VRRILREAGYWKPEDRQGKKKPSSQWAGRLTILGKQWMWTCCLCR